MGCNPCGGSSSPPPTPDPYAVADAQGKANLDAARTTANINRYDQLTPLGKQTWTRGVDSFDQAGYDKALTQYNADKASWQQRYDAAKAAGWGNGVVTSDFTSGVAQPTGTEEDWLKANAAPTEVDKGKYTTYNDKWTSSIELDPRVQALLDSQLATSQGLESSVQSSLKNLSNIFAKPIDYSTLPAWGDVSTIDPSGAWDRARSQLTGIDPQIGVAQDLASMGQASVGQAMRRLQQLNSTDLNYNNAPAMPVASEATRQAVADALYRQSTSRLDPRFTQDEDRLRTRLATQGITEGSEAYDREMKRFSDTRTDAYQQAIDAANAGSTDAMAKLFSMGLGARQQGVNEANTIRQSPLVEATTLANMGSTAGQDLRSYLQTQMGQASTASSLANDDINRSVTALNAKNQMRQAVLQELLSQRTGAINELNALRTGAQAAMPTFQGTPGVGQVAPAPVAQSVYNSYQGDLNNWSNQQAQNNAFLSGLMGMGGSYLGSSAGSGALTSFLAGI